MNTDESIALIESCVTIDELSQTLQTIIEDHGFSGFNFLDTGNAYQDVPYYFGTSGKSWESDYQSNGFVHVDECVNLARKTNTPFAWSDVPLPEYTGGPKPGTLRTMEAAWDHGFRNGLVVPYHFRDRVGRLYSTLCVLFWKSRADRFKSMIKLKKHELHIILLYWTQRAIDLIQLEPCRGGATLASNVSPICSKPLTDRERDVLSWAARGKTVATTADILSISSETVQSHLSNALRKLNASNKTHAAVKAVYLGLIDV